MVDLKELTRSDKDRLYHDLMQPLSHISMLTEIIRIDSSKYNIPEIHLQKLDSCLKSIKSAIDTALFILHDFLDMESPKFKSLSIKDILERMVQQYQLSYGSSGERVYELHFESDDFFLPQEKFVRIMNNLLSNATKYCPKGSIIVQVLSDDESYKLMIKDSGYGIPMEKLHLIFDRQANTNNQKAGLGVGLNIVQHLVEKLNGKIEVASTIGVGTYFTLKFPRTEKVDRGLYYENNFSNRRS